MTADRRIIKLRRRTTVEYVRDSDPQTELSQTRHITTKVGCKHCNGYFCIQVAVGALIYVFHSLNYIYSYIRSVMYR